mmetsp:Transcript_7438/g.24427  ORF Transcript_7438/g.24427 Transcript_7438/m.24427 type:complete len:210 (-) Transcript_7438:1212-1841(-)|eukprot:scaffold22879_cov92-Isochrysis_galbana.AAC.4
MVRRRARVVRKRAAGGEGGRAEGGGVEEVERVTDVTRGIRVPGALRGEWAEAVGCGGAEGVGGNAGGEGGASVRIASLRGRGGLGNRQGRITTPWNQTVALGRQHRCTSTISNRRRVLMTRGAFRSKGKRIAGDAGHRSAFRPSAKAPRALPMNLPMSLPMRLGRPIPRAVGSVHFALGCRVFPGLIPRRSLMGILLVGATALLRVRHD